MAQTIPDITLSRLSDLLAREMGLQFPRERWPDLERGVRSAAREFGFEDVYDCIRWLMSAPLSREQVETLATSLTIGETYFFRDPALLEVLEKEILPPLLRDRGRARRLRIWSAGCSTGEEPYTLAILLHRLIPDLERWNITILATDINRSALHQAVAGYYGRWSFRATPSWFKSDYFSQEGEERFRVIAEIRRMVTFHYLNLAEDSYPSLPTNTNAMDVIFCRNVLMYFSPETARGVVAKLERSLVDDGWLIFAPADLPAKFALLQPVVFGGATCYRKPANKQREEAAQARSAVDRQGGQPTGAGDAARRNPEAARQAPPAAKLERVRPVKAASASEASRRAGALAVRNPVRREGRAGKHAASSARTGVPGSSAPLGQGGEPGSAQAAESYEKAAALFGEGLYGEAAATLAELHKAAPLPSEAAALLARALANQGKLAEGVAVCDEALQEYKLDPSLHYLKAEILQEQGSIEEAQGALLRAVYLDPQLVMAHFALGNLALWRGNLAASDRHFRHALALLDGRAPGEVVPGSEGMTAARLRAMIDSVSAGARRAGGGRG